MNSKFKTVAGLFISILAGVALHAQHNITLQASPAAGGSVAAYADSGTVPLTAEQLRAVRGNPFATIRLSGSTNPGYEFNGWESSGGAEDKLPTILAGSAMIYSATTTLTANFSLRTYPLTVIVNPFEGGRAAGISGDRTRFVANEHAVLEVTGCPPDWEFVKWNVLSDQGGAATVASPTNRTTQVTLGTPADNGWVIEAEFRKVIDASKNAIIVSAAAGGYVVVKGSGTIAGGNNETFIGEEGQLLSMEAKPASSINYAFTGWEGVTGAGASLPNISVTFANTPQTVKAHFQAKSLKLTVRTDPASAGELTAKSGAVMFSSAGDSVGVSGSIPYNALTTLVASTPPGSNYDFDKFETSPPDFLPNLNINGDTATFSHTQNALVVTAKFKKLTDLNMLTVTSNTGGGVHVSGSYNTYANPALSPEANPVITKTVDVAAGTAEQVSFAQDTVVRLEANPAENYAFERWTDESGYTQGIEASGTISIPMIADRRITATFTRVASFLDVEVYPQAAFAAGARVKVAGTELPDRVSRSTHPSSLGWLAVQATGSGIWEFSHWESAGWPQIHGNNQASIGFDMSVDRSIRAVFVTKHRVTVTTSPAGAGGRAYLFEGWERSQMDYNTNAVATVYAEKTSPQWHFTGFTIAPSGGAMITVGGSPDPVNPARIRHQFEVTGDTTVTANFVQAVSGQMWVKKVTAANLNSEEDITGITNQDKLNIHGDSYVPHGDLLVPVRIVPPAASLSPFYFQPGGTIRLEAPESLDYPDGHTYRFVQWRVGVDSNNNGSWTPRAWGNYPARSVDYSIPSGATALIFYACYTDERLIQARVMLDNTLQTQSAVAAKGIAVKYNNAALAVGTDAVDNNLQYSDTGASLEVTVGGAAPAPAAPAGAAGAPRAAGARSAAAPAAAAAAAPAAGDDVIFRGWRVAGQSGGGANSIENPANPQTRMAVRADGSLTADFKSKVVLNLAIKTIPEGAALSLGTMVSGTNVTTGETLALGGGSTKSLSFGKGDTVTFTAEPEIRIGTDAYHFAGWDQNGNGEFEESERTGPGGFTPDTSLLASSATVFYERMHKLTVEISPANDNYYGTVSIETVQIPAERLPYTDEYGYGRARTLKATPGTGMQFVKWIVSGSAALSAADTVEVNAIAMYSDCGVIAEFAPRPNDLLVHVRVNGNTGVPDPSTGLRVDADGTQLASGQSKTYHYGDNAKLTPVIPPGGTYVFNRWETTGSPVKNAPGDAGVSAPLSNPGYVAILGPQTVYAHYTSVHRVTLNVETRGGGTGGTVTLDRSASPLLPRTESGNTYTYYYNDPCGMTASAAPGYRFLHWSIDDGSGNPPSTSTAARLSTGIHGDLTVTAVFAKEYTLTFAVIPRIDGTGQWDRTGGWLNKPAENTTFATYTAYHGERITAIEAVPNEDYDFGFVKWTTDAAALDTAGQPVDGSTSITTSLVVAGPHTLTASFTQVGREIKIIANITVDGVLDIGKTSGLGVFANGSTVPGSVTETKLAHGEEKAYYKGDRATLDATVPLALRDTYVFMAWEEGDAATREFTPLLASRTVTAHYRTKAKLTMAISPAGIGTTVPSVGEHPLPPDSERDYYVGKVIPTVSTDLTPDTLDYYAFTGWTTVGGAGPSNPAATITSIGLDVREKTLTANYVPGHRLEVRVKYESETDASQPVQFTTVPGSRVSQASGGVSLPEGGTNSAGIWQPGPQVCYDSLRTMPAGADVEIRAYAASPYYRFAGWIQNEGDTPSGGPNLVVRMDEPKTYTAVFERVRVQLKVHTVPADVPGVKAEAVTKAKLIAGGGVEPRVYEVFYGHNPVLEASSTNSEFGFSRWIRGGSYTALLPGEVAITTNPWTPGELVAPVTEVMAVFTGGGGTRRLFLFTEPEDSVDIHHVDAPGAISRTYTTMTFPDGKTRPVCIAYVAVSSESTYTLIDIHADSAAKDQPGDRLTSDGASYGFVHWEAEEYNFDRGAADGYLQDAYSADTKIKYPRSTELTGDGSLYYTAIYGPPGGHLLVLRLDLGNEDGSPLDIDERYKDDFKQIIGFNDLLGNINGSTRNRSGNPVLFVNRVVPEKRAIFSGEHDETFSADEVFKASPYNIYQWTHERPFGTVIARATGDNPTFVMGGTSVPATPAPAPAAAAAPSAAAAAAPSAAAAAPYAWSGWGWVWGHGGWGWVRQSSAGTDYGVHSGVTGESERVTAYVDLLQNRVSMTKPAFIQPPTWPTTPVVANPGDFTFLLYDVTQVPMDIFLAKTIDSPPAPYVKQAMRATGGTPPVLNLTSVPANYRHAGWSLDGSTTAAFAGSGFTWASWPSRWPKKLEEDIEVTPVYIRQMEVTATLRASDEAVGGFGRNFGDKVEFMGRGTIDKGTLTLSSTRDYGSIVQFKAKPDASQHHVLEKWIVEKATADGGTVFDPADTQEFLEDSDAAEILLELAVDCPIKVTAVFGYKKFPFHANVADSLDGAKHGKVMIDGSPAGGGLFVTASSFYSKVHTITAIPDAGYAFNPNIGWTISPLAASPGFTPADSYAPETTISVDVEKTATAHFERMVTLTMKLTPADLMTSEHSSLTTPMAGTHSILDGRQLVDASLVEITAGTDGDYDFIDWTIEDDGGERTTATPSVTLNLRGNTTATANYIRLHEVTLSVDPAPFAEESQARMGTTTYATASSLTVVANGSTATGAKKYRAGAVLNLRATPGVHFDFKHWEITIDGTPQAPVTDAVTTLTVTAPIDIKAVYVPKNYTITVNHSSSDAPPPGVNPPMAATLTAAYVSIFGTEAVHNLLADGNSVTLPYGTNITLATTPAQYYAFYRWTGGDPTPSTTMPLTFKVDGNRTLTAWFTRSHYLLTTTILPDASKGSLEVLSGSRTGNPSVHVKGEVIKLGVVDAPTTVFQQWENGSTDRERTVTMNEDHALTATFVKAVLVRVTADSARGTVTIDSTGTPRKTVDGYYVFAEGDSVALSANPATHYDFDRWAFAPARPEGASADNEAALTFTARENVDITAFFTEKNYTIKVTADPAAGAASITGTQASLVTHDFLAVDTTSRLYGSPPMTVTVTPKDEAGARYRFANWSDGGGLTNPARDWNCDDNVVWKAILKQQALVKVNNPVNITHDAGGEPGGGSVSVTPAGAAGEYRVDVGGAIEITPTPDTGYEFVEWRGLPGSGVTVNSTSGRLTLAITTTNAGEDIVLTPCFRKKSYRVTVKQWNQTDGSEIGLAGSISLAPAFASADNKYLHGTEVTAKVDTVYLGYQFVGWDTDGTHSTIEVPSNETKTCTFSITDDTTLWAVFKKVKRLTLRADPSSVGTATVVGASNGYMVIVNEAQGIYEFDVGATVTIKAESTSAHTFREWAGLVASGSSPETTVVMEEDRVVVARFELMEFRDLTINVSPAGVGAVSVRGEASITDSRTISCGKDTVVMLTAAATMPGYEFTGWSGDASGASPGVYVTMDEPRTVTASFARALYNVTARPQIAGRGTVTMTSAGHADVVNDTGRYYYDEEVTLTAVEAPGYRFVDWVANVGGLALPVASSTGPIRVTGAMIIEARFEHAGTEGVLVNVSGGSVLSRVQSEPDANGDYIEEITFAPDAYHEFTTLDGDAYNYEHLSNGNLKCWVWVPKGGGFQSVTATFTLTSFTATAESDPAGAGEVQILVEGEDHSFRREEGGPLYYPAGTLLRFMANETRDWEFNSWANIEGEILDSSNPKSVLVKVTKDISAKARFDPMKRSRTVTLMMDFMNGAVCEDASITMGDATHKWNDGAIIKTFREGESVNASCEVLDDRGLPVPFKVERWDGPFLATIGDDGTRSTVAGTMLAEDVTLVVNITRIKAILQTMSATWMLNGTLQDETSIISDGGLITVGDMYEMGTEAMVWLSVKPGYYLAMDKGDDGWTLTPDGIRLQGRESAFVPFEVATHGTWTGGNDDTDALDPKIKHPHYREYDQDADGNYIVPGYDGTLVIKYTDPSLPAPDFTDPAVISDPSKWRQYGKRVRLDSEKTEIKAKTTEDEFFARRAGEYFLDTDSPVKLDSRRDKSGNLLIRGGVETTPAP